MARPRLSEGTRKRLLEASTHAFLRQGYHGTGLKDLLDSVEIPKGSFYNYYPSKEALAVATIEHTQRCTAESLTAALENAPNPVTGLRAFFQAQAAEFERTRFEGGCLLANLAGELDESEACRVALFTAFLHWRDGVRDAIADAQRLGLIRADEDAAELADMLIEAWEGAVIRMKVERSVEPLHKCLRRLLDGYFRP
ncbi:transcriptional regulator, TetR family [Actinokineospora alba]|uniref:Transcriptional regulator, TetR family n=1 Tax=Actinokineospora alba TaxID=504798 RepID=A0A1H0V8B9_9PSEU|nr:TetR/AcrR family transcriptional regulator [Actinokineospora alba]TDP65537.1 TetR family transcriptional regulator [Actinokineospora alba]SDH64836.1 TetR/AcrR family transcriptional regulator, transcriptional repressor for nem operon [Actinokineospora alba]SDP74690.1 transcriptional regulator, TetR family [Actinokineospora alba]